MSLSQVASGLDHGGAEIAVGVSGMAGNQMAKMRGDSRTAAGGQASVGSAIRDGAGDRRTPAALQRPTATHLPAAEIRPGVCHSTASRPPTVPVPCCIRTTA